MVDFPTGLPDVPNAVGTNPLLTFHGAESHSTSTNRMIANILALATKLGTGSSSPPASAAVLRRTGTGASSWQQIQAGDYAAGSIVNADVGASAAIALSKLAAGASGLVKSNGTAISAGNQLASGDVPNLLIATAMLANNATFQASIAEGSTVDPTTTSASWSDVAQMSITMTTTGGMVLLLFSARLSHNTAGGQLGIGIEVDGGMASTTERVAHYYAANAELALTTLYLLTPSAAGHTFKGKWYVTTGTGKAVSAHRHLIAVEFKK